MNAAETIAAAIEKLEAQRDEASGNGVSWEFGPSDKFEYEVFASDSDSAHAFTTAADADLIVTLHRTIDAQLAILRNARIAVEAVGDGPRAPLGIPESLALARAILGAES